MSLMSLHGHDARAQVTPAARNASPRLLKQRTEVYTSSSEPVTDADSINSKFYFLKGIGNKVSGNMDAAVQNFTESLKYDGNNDAACYELALARFNAKAYPEALEFITRAVNLKPGQIWYLNLLATVYDQKNDFSRLAKVYTRMIQLEPDKMNYYLAAANALGNAGDYNGAIAILNEAEKNNEIQEDIEFQKQKIYLKTNQPAKAVQSMQVLIGINPSEPRYYLLLAEIYRSQNQAALVFAALQKAIHADPGNGFAQLALSDYYRALGDKQATFTALKNAFASDDIELEQKKRLIIDNYVTIHTGDQQEGMELARIIALSNPGDVQAQALYAGFLSNNPATTSVGRDAVISQLEQNKENFSLWANLIISDFNLQDYTAAVRHTGEALTYFPNQVILHWYQGIAFNQLKKYKAAIESLNAGLLLGSGQAELEAQLYQVLGDAFHGQGDNRSSDNAYEESLKRRPDDAGTLNNFAYYLCSRKKNLAVAATMSRKANLLEPDNANFEDTLAWILYNEQAYAEALVWIEKALIHSAGNSSTLLDHYGDILFRSGKPEAAVANWKKARAAGSSDLNLGRKIANKKIYE